jgi:hypothetical protein
MCSGGRFICQRLIYVNNVRSFAFPAHLFSIFLNLFGGLSPKHLPSRERPSSANAYFWQAKENSKEETLIRCFLLAVETN